MKHKKVILTIFILGALILIPLISVSWNIDGTLICSAANNQSGINICSDDDGNSIMVWFYDRISIDWNSIANYV